VMRTAVGEPMHVLTTTQAPSFDDYAVAENAAYIYAVRAVSTVGQRSAYSAPDASTTVGFIDNPLQAGSTLVRALHVNQIRIAIDALRAVAGLSPTPGTMASVGSPIRAVDIEELRSGVAEARQQLGLAARTFGDSAPLLSKIIEATHLEELRASVE
jgi:hypothetical protein